MKTLDEVIKALEKCHIVEDQTCVDCPYYPGKGWCEEKDRDALHYLKEYQKLRKALNLKVVGNEPLLELLIDILRGIRK